MASRFYRWRKAGIWQQILDALQQQADTTGALEWTIQYVDATVIRAHQHAAGAAGSDAEAVALGVARAAVAPRSTCGPRGAASQ